MWVLLKTILKIIIHRPLTNLDRFRMKSDVEITETIERLAVLRDIYNAEFTEKCCKVCPVQHLNIAVGEDLELHPCDFEDGVCPHGNALLWWLCQPAED